MNKTCRNSSPQTPALKRNADLLALALACLLVLVLALVSGCGGGDHEEEDRTETPGVDCKARPELCE